MKPGQASMTEQVAFMRGRRRFGHAARARISWLRRNQQGEWIGDWLILVRAHWP